MHIVSDIEKNNFRHSPDCRENPAMERRSEAERSRVMRNCNGKRETATNKT
ncbi:hypothetical protein [Candidatus Chryseobacterium massiliense]|uniref:hypothetical protein n=1 Tax=Candidatus Chryseobacterium massiliense TaxID=204089 RepID=UPI001300A3C3|nr:hypothetical protein [Candidatus Chryseobacterium massiliae]